MQALDITSIEEKLARLMPPALSEGFQCELDEMIDELAADLPVTEHAVIAPVTSTKRGWIGLGIAAAIGGLCALPFFLTERPSSVRQLASNLTTDQLIPISESDRIQSVTDEGLQEQADGSAMQAVSYRNIQESKLKDPETGDVIQVLITSNETLLSPVSSF